MDEGRAELSPKIARHTSMRESLLSTGSKFERIDPISVFSLPSYEKGTDKEDLIEWNFAHLDALATQTKVK